MLNVAKDKSTPKCKTVAPSTGELADPGVESLLAAVGLDVVDDGPMQGRGAAHPPRAHQHHMHTHLVISYSALNANTS